MIENSVTYAHEYASPEIDSIQSYESDLRHAAQLRIGANALALSLSTGSLRPIEQVDNSRGITGMDNMQMSSSNPEGSRNAELFKQAYDSVIESIENALKADGTALSNRLATILGSIDVLAATPYISSVPEFVGLVKDARHNIELASIYIASDDSPEASLVVASTLSQAKQQIAATTVAYRP